MIGIIVPTKLGVSFGGIIGRGAHPGVRSILMEEVRPEGCRREPNVADVGRVDENWKDKESSVMCPCFPGVCPPVTGGTPW